MGSGYRGTLEQLTPAAQARIRTHNLTYLADQTVSRVEANVVYSISLKREGGTWPST